MDTITARFAARLHYFRNERGLTQAALAQKSGLHTNFVSALENQRQIASLVTAERLARALGVDLAALVNYPLKGAKGKKDRMNQEVDLATRALSRCKDPKQLRRIRKAIEALMAL